MCSKVLWLNIFFFVKVRNCFLGLKERKVNYVVDFFVDECFVLEYVVRSLDGLNIILFFGFIMVLVDFLGKYVVRENLVDFFFKKKVN